LASKIVLAKTVDLTAFPRLASLRFWAGGRPLTTTPTPTIEQSGLAHPLRFCSMQTVGLPLALFTLSLEGSQSKGTRKWRNELAGGYLPVKAGARFWMKCATPSLKSSDCRLASISCSEIANASASVWNIAS